MDILIALNDPPKEVIENISVYILRRPNARLRMFFCMICRAGLLQYKGSIVQVIPGDPEADLEDIDAFPFIVRCSGRSEKYGRCPARYIIQGYSEPM